MKIGITCYPTYGGSGVVATELGMELAARGHEIHFISYAPPIRLTDTNERIQFHEVEISSYPLFDHAPYALSLAVKMMQVAEAEGLDLLHVHYAIPHSVSALLARMMAAPKPLPFITTLHGTDITLVGNDRSFLPITKFSIEQSDGVTAISHYLKQRTIEEFDIKRPIEVIPNFVNCDLYRRTPDPALRAEWAPGRRAHPDAPVEFPARQAAHGRRRNIRNGARENARQAGAHRRRPGPRRRRIPGPQEEARARRPFPRQAGPRLPAPFRRPICSCCLRTWNRSASRRWKPWPAKSRSWRRTWAACRKWSSTESTAIFLRRAKWKLAQDTPWKYCRKPDRGRAMGQTARVNAKKKYCANDVIPIYEAYYRQVIGALAATHA